MERTRGEASAKLRSGYASTRSVSLAPAAQRTPPQPKDPISKCPQTREVSWYRVIVEVALDDRLQPSSGLGQRIVHAHSKLLLDLSQLASHAADRRAAYHEAS